MANLQSRYDSVGVVVKLRPDESEYVVCAVVGGAEVPFAVVSVAKLNKLLDAAAAEQQAQPLGAAQPETAVAGAPPPPPPVQQ